MINKLLKVFLLTCIACVLSVCSVACFGANPDDPNNGDGDGSSEVESSADLNGGYNLNYVLLDDGTYGVTVGECYVVPEIIVPAKHQGVKVTTILENFFEQYQKVVGLDQYGNEIKLNNGHIVTYSIVISEGVTTMQNGAFSSITKLKRLEIPSTMVNFGEDVGTYDVYEIYNKTSFTFENGYDDSQIPYGYIARDVVNIYTPSNGTRKVTMDNNGMVTYQSDDGKKALMSYCGQNTNLVVPADIDYIFENGCFDNAVIEELTIPATCKEINDYAFFNCTNLKRIYIANGVEKINDAFGWLSSLEFVYVPQSVNTLTSYSFNRLNTGVVCYYYAENEMAQNNWYENTDSYCDSLYGVKSLDVTADGFVYAVMESKVYLIKYLGDAKQVVIADTYLSKPVTQIFNRAFMYNDNIVSVSGGNNVTKIGREAFYKCSRLYEAVISDSVTGIAENGFADCENLTLVTLGANVSNTYYTAGMAAFSDCTKLCEVYNKSSHQNAMSGITSAVSPENVYTTPNGSKITVENGLVLYTDGATCKVVNYVGDSTEVVIPDKATEIRKYAFSNQNITKVVIGSGVTKIAQYAFAYCNDLVDVTIPVSVTSIEINAFNCTNLKKINYLGTLAQWGAVDKYQGGWGWSSWKVDALEKVVCTDGEETY